MGRDRMKGCGGEVRRWGVEGGREMGCGGR